MPRYRYSIVRFVPSPTRGEQVNLGMIVGCDATSEWVIEIADQKSRAKKLDDAGIWPQVAAELERLKLRFPTDDEYAISSSGPEINEEWLAQMAAQSKNVIQYSTPQLVLAEDAESAVAKLWDTFIVESVRPKRNAVSKREVVSRYLKSLSSNHLGKEHLKKHARLKTSHKSTSIDVAIHNGVAKRLTQCWSLQVQDTEKLLNEVKAWSWTMQVLRQSGGVITTQSGSIGVPKNVELSIVYAQSTENQADEFTQETIDIISHSEVDARSVLLEQTEQHAAEGAALLKVQTS
ncbi:MAG: DUF3037 domain-containing protein [Planctomycetaceae bacterium]